MYIIYASTFPEHTVFYRTNLQQITKDLHKLEKGLTLLDEYIFVASNKINTASMMYLISLLVLRAQLIIYSNNLAHVTCSKLNQIRFLHLQTRTHH